MKQSNTCTPNGGMMVYCQPDEHIHLHEDLPTDLIPSKPIGDGNHRIFSNPQCVDGICGQRISLTTMQGHEIRMMDMPSGVNNIAITTSDATQHIRLDELNKISWYTSANHHMIYADKGHEKAAFEAGSAQYLDPNVAQHKFFNNSTYQLIMTEKKHKIWLSDSSLCPRIHLSTTSGHELLLLDHDQGVDATMMVENKGKIQITTNDKLMQITMDVEKGEISIQNHNLTGSGQTGSIKMFAAENIEFHAEGEIIGRGRLNIDMQSCDGEFIGIGSDHTVLVIPTGPGDKPIPSEIKPSVRVDLIIADPAY